jgi:hypothetical protein
VIIYYILTDMRRLVNGKQIKIPADQVRYFYSPCKVDSSFVKVFLFDLLSHTLMVMLCSVFVNRNAYGYPQVSLAQARGSVSTLADGSAGSKLTGARPAPLCACSIVSRNPV